LNTREGKKGGCIGGEEREGGGKREREKFVYAGIQT
jgi:hypothetical protein